MTWTYQPVLRAMDWLSHWARAGRADHRTTDPRANAEMLKR